MGWRCRGVGLTRKSFFWTRISHFLFFTFHLPYLRSKSVPGPFQVRFRTEEGAKVNGTCIDFGTDLHGKKIWGTSLAERKKQLGFYLRKFISKTMENALSIHSIAALFVQICAHDEKSLQKLRKKEKKYYLCNLIDSI